MTCFTRKQKRRKWGIIKIYKRDGGSVKNTFFTRKFVSAHTCHKFVMHKERVQK